MTGQPGMEWAESLTWVEVPVAEDGGEDHIGSRSDVRAYVGWDLQPDRVTPVAVVLRNADGSAVSPAQWRRLKSSEIIDAARNMLRLSGEIGSWPPELWLAVGAVRQLLTGSSMDPPFSPEERAAAEVMLAALGDDDAPRDRKYGPEHYRLVGQLYDAAVAASDPQPVQAVRRAMRRTFPDLKETTVRGWIRTAKERGHITTRARKSRG